MHLLEEKISSNDYKRWANLLTFYSTEEHSFVIAPNEHFVQLLNSKSIWQEIEKICDDKNFEMPELITKGSQKYKTLNIASAIINPEKPASVKYKLPEKADDLINKVTQKLNPKKRQPSCRHEHYTFENFFEGKSNQLALQVSKNLCEQGDGQDAMLYNPLFIYGQSGDGKTHLLHAIKNKIIAMDDGRKVYYQQASEFVSRLVLSIRNNKMSDFKEFYRQYDVLLIDDVEFFVSKSSSLEEFFQLMSFFIENNRQIVLTSDRPSHEIDMPDRIRSRLASGLSAYISHPGFELRVNILYTMARKVGLNLSQDLIYVIASKAKVSIRELHGIIKMIKANIDLNGYRQEITLKDMDDILMPTLRRMNVMVTPKQVIDTITEYYALRTGELVSKVRRRPIVEARHIAMYIMRENTTLSLDEIGKCFSRDHSSVIHAIRKIKKEVKTNSILAKNLENLSMKLLNNN